MPYLTAWCAISCSGLSLPPHTYRISFMPPEEGTRPLLEEHQVCARDSPAHIHHKELEKYPHVPVSYLGGGWYRPILPVQHLHGSIDPRPCSTRTEVRQAATPGESAINGSDPLQSHKQQSVLQSFPGETVHFTQLRDHPGAEFREIGNGRYVRDASRSGG